MAKKNALKKPAVVAPQDLEAAVRYLAEIAELNRQIDDEENELNRQVASLQERAIEKTAPLEERLEGLFDGLQAFAEANRANFTAGGKKSVELPTGSFGWRMNPLAVTLRNVEQVLKQLEELKLKRFIRVKKEVDKEAILKEPEAVDKVRGIKISQEEQFYVKPLALGLEITDPRKRPKKDK